MVQLILVKVTVQPVLHIVTMEMRDCGTRLVLMWAAWAAGGRSGRSRVHVCVDCTLSLLGRRSMRGAAAGSMLAVGALVVKMACCPVIKDGPLFDIGGISCYGLD